jgi:hypothetical protein
MIESSNMVVGNENTFLGKIARQMFSGGNPPHPYQSNS